MPSSRFVCFAAFWFVFLSGQIASALEPDNRPNVLFIAVDDLNDWVGCLGGHPQAYTPNIDRLARRGVLFANAHCAAPACNPSRAAVFSGKMPWKTGVWSNSSRKLLQQHPDAVILPRAFERSGYATMGTGKLLHPNGTGNEGAFETLFHTEQRWSPFTKSGVEYSADELPSKSTRQPQHIASLPGDRPVRLPLNQLPSDRNPVRAGGESFDWGPLLIEDQEMGDTQITNWALERLSERNHKPVFLGVGYYRPHIPLYAPAAYFERFAGSDVVLPKTNAGDLNDLPVLGKQFAIEAVTAGLHSTVTLNGRSDRKWKQAVAAYLACTTFVDAQIGRLLDALDASPIADNTVIVLWSDHGWHLGEKQHWGKWTGWERSTRVPLIVVPPKRLRSQYAQPGSVCQAPVSLVDLYPTLAELCRIEAPQDLDGESLVPLLEDPDRRTSRFALTVFGPGNLSIRDQRWRLIRYEDETRELYDLQQDPNEWKNLIGNQTHYEYERELAKRIPPQALPQEQQAEFERLKSRVRRFSVQESYNHGQPILFRSEFDQGGIDRLSISEDDHYSIARPSPRRLKIVDAPKSPGGKKAVQFDVPNSIKGAFRSELSLVHEPGFQERWYSASLYIPEDWVDDMGRGSDIVMQWHAIRGNWQATYPNMSLLIDDGAWYVRRSFGSPQQGPDRQVIPLGKVIKGRWTDWIFHVKWTPEADGQIRVWQDGQQVINQQGPNVYGTIGVDYTPYLKFGIYHPEWKHRAAELDPAKHQTRRIFIKDLVVESERTAPPKDSKQ